jgi:hypothetical protein
MLLETISNAVAFKRPTIRNNNMADKQIWDSDTSAT